MIPDWASEYIGIPWKDKGRDHDGCDCYGLLRLVKGEKEGVWIPSLVEDYITAVDLKDVGALMRGEIHRRWLPIDAKEARCFDAAMITVSGEDYHPGVVIEPPFFLNVFAGTATAISKWTSPEWSRRVRFYRYVG